MGENKKGNYMSNTPPIGNQQNGHGILELTDILTAMLTNPAGPATLNGFTTPPPTNGPTVHPTTPVTPQQDTASEGTESRNQRQP